MPPPGPVSPTLYEVGAIGVVISGTVWIVAGTDATVDGIVDVIVDGVDIGGSSGIAGLAKTLLSATTGCVGVATFVDSKTGTGSETPGFTTAVACNTAGGKADVARHSFLPFVLPQTHTTDFFLRTTPDLIHTTDRP